MYKEAAEIITNSGLSLPARILLAIFSVIFGLIMVATAQNSDKAIYIYTFGVFCFAIAAACLTKGRVRQFIGSTVGTGIFLLSIWYFFSEIQSGSFLSNQTSESSILGAIKFFCLFGVPSVLYVLKVRFGFSKKQS